LTQTRTYKVSGSKIYFKFSYNPDIVFDIKQVHGRAYIPVTKEWVVENDIVNSKQIREFINKHGFKLTEGEFLNDISQSDVNVLTTDYVSNFDLSKFNFQPRPYQIEVINYMLTKKCVINGDDVGIGKTYEAIFSVEIGDLLPCLVITLDSVKQHWKQSWLSVIERKIQVINAGDTFEQGMDIYIINYQSLAKKGEIKENGKDFEVEIKHKELQQIEFKSIVVDESHSLKNGKSLRSKAVKKLAKKIPYVFLLTGTAIMNRSSELINPLQIIRVFDKVFGGWNSYIQKFCDAKKTPFGLDISGNSNTKELNQILRQNCYIRREKSEVLKDLPDMQQTLLPVSISNKFKYNKAEKNFIAYLKENKGEIAADKAESAEFLVLRNELRQLVGIGKVESVKEFVDSLLEETADKIIIFGIHKEPLKQLADYYKCWLIDGSIKSEDKQLIIDDFKESKERILLGNMNALGTGTDGLQYVSSTMIIFELPDRPSDLTQVSGRLHRSGQKNNVQIILPVVNDTIDDVLWENIEQKMIVTEAVNSGRDVKQKSLNSIILRKFLNKK
jgi:SWI/SNF-related matrix-associated actin-dependent regulator 1 of chromatin subfamily A